MLSLSPSLVMLALATMGAHGPRGPKAGRCESCGVEASVVRSQVLALRSSPKRRARDRAAQALARCNWRCHPEAVLALCDALRLDPDDDVREEAAESLGKMRPFVPIVHETLRRAAEADPEDDVREEARDALANLGRRCIADCPICGPLPTGSVFLAPTVIPPGWLEIIAPDPAPMPVPVPRLEIRSTPAEDLPPALPETLPPPAPRPIPLEGPVGGRPEDRPDR